ncbi:MAG: hypothetical protein ACHQ52_13215 [Candidatus Eisenbacteria bacterium]
MRRSIETQALAALLLAVAMLDGCGGKSSTAPEPLAGMPPPDSPSGVLRAFEWAWNQRLPDAYKPLFTADYTFAFAALDTAAHRYATTPWSRSDEQIAFANLASSAAGITVRFDKTFAVFPDPRPGKSDDLRRKNIRTQVLLTIYLHDGSLINVQGNANFFLVRGDSAAIPPDLGLGSDSGRWYIERWEDETYAGGIGSRIQPAMVTTWGDVKVRFRDLSPPARSFASLPARRAPPVTPRGARS